ncbi:type II toxin-antitoxin system VapB family antitoxin [Phreatobacter sp.]|jgi:antitoxin VapB|uniref:type II toxin-antitoxin system VapB family antitoxin n=1 Tax=Phreatobacter sp. TaxID=1966341 RepID=UPI0025FDDCA7|nr:type II toxin-antitoxin system VapB family antitoxin [Phreatobacter sp.]
MALNIKDAEADRLARQVARLTGESITRTVVIALQEKLAREERRRNDAGMLVDDVLAIARHLSAQPTLDTRSDEEILGFDATGR